MTEVNGVALGTVLAGIVFAYGGLTGKSPSAAFLSIVRGSNPGTLPNTQQIADPTVGLSKGPTPGTATSGEGSSGAPVGSSGAHNQAIAHLMMGSYGWNDATNRNALDQLWTKESGWNNTADTRQTGAGGDHPGSSEFAYGIAQARPATKYPKAGQPPDLGGNADPTVQIRWGLDYIRGRYGSPAAAWQHEIANNWY
jgi:resuscitation-promoting factor RpfB